MSVLKSRGAKGIAAREKLLQLRREQSGWTKERDETMLKMLLRGATYQTVAEHLNVSRSAISGRLDRLKDRFSGLLAGEDGRPASVAMAAFETGLTATAGEALYRLICKGLGDQAI